MNTTALKSFAPAVRHQLMEAVARKLDHVLSAQTPDYLTTFAPQVDSLRNLTHADRPGLIERVAYTWFNRLTALRYLDAKGWHPFRARVLTPANSGETQPELFKLTRTGALPDELRLHTNPKRLDDLLDGRVPSSDPQGEVYRHLVLAACRYYHTLLPNLFERLDDETELLLPDDLLTEHSIAHGFRTEITDADCAEVEVLGWLYQFYISEKKDVVMGRKTTVPAEDIPAVTQIFTPHWIVRYLVENSLGRLWLLNRPASHLREKMRYYIESETEPTFLRISKPHEIRVLDPAVGSGHMLTYAFDLLYAIYEEDGHAPSDIPGLILTHNLHGVDICPRAAQLAALALVLKAREKSRRFFQGDNLVRPRIMCLEDVQFESGELHEYIEAVDRDELRGIPMMKLLHQFEEARNYGALIRPCLDERQLMLARGAIELKTFSDRLFLNETHRKVCSVLEQATMLSQQYQVVVTNPPYMGSGAMNGALKCFVDKEWNAGKADSYAAFILRNLSLTITEGFTAMITIPNWMFRTTFQSLRRGVLGAATISSLIHCGRGVWGADFGSCAFVIKSSVGPSPPGTYKRLFKRSSEVRTNEEIEANFFNEVEFPSYIGDSALFQKVPGSPIAYWVSRRLCETFALGTPIGQAAKKGLSCSGTDLFYRFFWEPEYQHLSIATGRTWFPITKGGPFRKWFGNNEYVINWKDGGCAIKTRTDDDGEPLAVVRNEAVYFREGGSWNDVSIGMLCCRYTPAGAIPTDSGPMVYSSESLLLLIAFLNSCVAKLYADLLCPTVHFGVGQIALFPILSVPGLSAERVQSLIDSARRDWDNGETSWDFSIVPLLRPGVKAATLEASWQRWKVECDIAIHRMRELETENNRLFIEAYGLQAELQADVPLDRITLARANARKDVAAFLSYAIGCMMGRYSLDEPGLILANAGDKLARYVAKVGKPMDQLAYPPDGDGIVPVLDGDWFDDDIAARTRDFLRVTFGEATLRENVRFIEQSLGKDLRKYFLADFYKDHLQAYKKRPVYWLVQSPLKGFSVLIYLHRYTRDTMNLVLNRYLREYQAKLRGRLAHLAQAQASEATSASDKSTARKEADKLIKTLRECEEWERNTILPLAQARIELDLDDGVKANYLKLGEALAPIPGLSAAEE